MIPPPSTLDVSDTSLVADWVELATLCDDAGHVSTTDVLVTLSQHGLLPTSRADGLGDEESIDDDPATDDDDQQRVTVDRVWRELRRATSGERYSVTVEDSHAARNAAESWRAFPARVATLLWCLGPYYGFGSDDDPVAGTGPIKWRAFEDHFETITLASSRGACGAGVAAPMPATNAAGGGLGVRDRVRALAKVMSLDPIEPEIQKIRPQEKDISLDVLVRVSPGSDGGGALYLFIDATVGDWKEKIGKPKLPRWIPLFSWDSTVEMFVRCIAVPHQVTDDTGDTRSWISRNTDAVVLDRHRIFAQQPDVHLETAEIDSLLCWCEPRMDYLRELTGRTA